MAYPSTATLVAGSSVEELTSLSVPQQDALRAASISAIESHTGQVFDAVTTTLTIDGSGSGDLYLPRRLESFTVLQVKGVGIPIADAVLNDDHSRLSWAGAGLGYYEQALAALDDTLPRDFAYESNSIKITGVWGWSVCPAAVVQAIRWDMEDQALADASQISPTIRAYRRLGVAGISQGNLQATLSAGGETLSDRVRVLLEDYCWAGEIGRVV